MKGCMKTLKPNANSLSKTNFNDWSDSKLRKLPKKIVDNRMASTTATSTTMSTTTGSSILEVKRQTSISSDTSVKIELLRKKIREGYPLLSKKEIRLIKLPFYQSLIENLKEDGFIGASQYIHDLIEMDEKWHTKRLSHIKNRTTLKSSSKSLTILSDGLTAAEVARKEHNGNQELTSMLKMAVHFGDKCKDQWHWLAEELYEQCEGIIFVERETLDKELIAISKYSFASFLFHALQDTDRSKSMVEDSMELSKGTFWNPSIILGQQFDILYFECCLLLHKIYLWMANETKSVDIEDAISLCRHALYWAKQIDCKSAEVSALLNLIIIYIEAHKYDFVQTYIDEYMKVCNTLGDAQALCEGYIVTAHFHECLGEEGLMIEDIKALLQLAEENSILKMMAFAHRNLATLYFIRGKQKEMLEHAVEAYKLYVNLGSRSEMDEAMCLTGIAQAQEFMPQYLQVMLDSNEIEDTEFNMLMQWKTLHIPFFSNIILFQPEIKINEEIKGRMVTGKMEDMALTIKARQNHTLVTSNSVNTLKNLHMRPFNSISIGTSNSTKGKPISQSLMNFQTQMKKGDSVQLFM